MRYFECETKDGTRVQGLITAPDLARTVIVHVHGFGGDFISNRFVQRMHDALPAAGIAFASFNHRLSGYVVEKYSESGVTYCGAAMSDPASAVQDLESVVRLLREGFPSVVLQGHSFGTNLVKNFARRAGWLGDLCFLSPSDSQWLYEGWRRQHPGDPHSRAGVTLSGDGIAFDIFGVGVATTEYCLPISRTALGTLLGSEVFSEWSRTDLPPCVNRSLVVFGDADSIALGGATGSSKQLAAWLPHATVTEIPKVGHLFSGEEDALIEKLIQFIQS